MRKEIKAEAARDEERLRLHKKSGTKETFKPHRPLAGCLHQPGNKLEPRLVAKAVKPLLRIWDAVS